VTYRVGVDIGGTFTDVQLLDEHTGALLEAKVPSTPEDSAQGFLAGLHAVLGPAELEPKDVGLVVHGTTIATNALLERRFEPIGLILTRGYRTLLEYARVHVPGAFGTWLFYQQPDRVVPLELVREALERVDHTGSVLQPLNEAGVVESAQWYRELGITSVGVSLLWSFMNPHHERRIREIFAEVHPDCEVTLSSEVLPEIREYERAFTTALSAALKPTVGSYLDRLERLLGEERLGGALLCMKSSGGVLSARRAKAHPVELVLSGPAAGVLGMAGICESLGFAKAITVDMGGTSTDISFIEDFQPLTSTDGDINAYPIRVPVIDIHTIGAGGGSIAWVAAGGKPQVGPRSAGAVPGPAAYGQGGIEATVSDANLVLGRLPSGLLGGRLELDVDAAQRAVGEFGDRLGLDLVDAAMTIVELAIGNMDMAIREVSTRKGRDPRECVLVCFGGAGPGHGARLAQLLEIPTVLFPRTPGVGATIGLLATDIRSDFGKSIVVGLDDPGCLERIAEAYAELAGQAWDTLATEGVPMDRRDLVISVDLRYRRQQYTINVPLPLTPGRAWDSPPTHEELDAGRMNFHRAHKRLCGFDYSSDDGMGVDLVNLRVAAIGRLPRPELGSIASRNGKPFDALVGRRDVYFDEEGSFISTPIFDRARLLAGDRLSGPAIVEEFDSTALVLPGQEGHVDRVGNIVVTAVA
jgi:N-methylhydantoinase A